MVGEGISVNQGEGMGGAPKRLTLRALVLVPNTRCPVRSTFSAFVSCFFCSDLNVNITVKGSIHHWTLSSWTIITKKFSTFYNVSTLFDSNVRLWLMVECYPTEFEEKYSDGKIPEPLESYLKHIAKTGDIL